MSNFSSVQQYPWWQLAQKRHLDWNETLDSTLEQIAASGYRNWEPCPSSAEDLNRLIHLSEKHGLGIKSVYIGGVFHDERVNETKKMFSEILPALAEHKIHIVVCNPEPTIWSEKVDKTDAQLRFQAASFQEVGEMCAQYDIRLGYHVHDPEFRCGAREFHHMMLHTSSATVFFCLDTHWVYRGAGNSVLALLDIISLYGKRVVEMHLRQSRDGVWSETFEEGDIDYNVVVDELRKQNVELLKQNIRPLLVIEQAYEENTPSSLDVSEANARGLAYLERVFQPLLED